MRGCFEKMYICCRKPVKKKKAIRYSKGLNFESYPDFDCRYKRGEEN